MAKEPSLPSRDGHSARAACCPRTPSPWAAKEASRVSRKALRNAGLHFPEAGSRASVRAAAGSPKGAFPVKNCTEQVGPLPGDPLVVS